MQVSEVQITLIKPKDGLIGFASLVIGQALFLGGIGIHRKLNGSGYRLTYPTRRSGEQNFNVFHPITREAGQAIEQAIFEKLNDVMNKGGRDAGYGRPDAA
ncbi:MAG: hypothetical protein GC136_11290 [Alphaproteobacteria bacterium]|nr:hypothetical protein [Alphaproteobacteria bacterium]